MLIADKLTPTIRLYAIVTLIRLAYRRWLIHEQARQSEAAFQIVC